MKDLGRLFRSYYHAKQATWAKYLRDIEIYHSRLPYEKNWPTTYRGRHNSYTTLPATWYVEGLPAM